MSVSMPDTRGELKSIDFSFIISDHKEISVSGSDSIPFVRAGLSNFIGKKGSLLPSSSRA
jgi:hypothetical protein